MRQARGQQKRACMRTPPPRTWCSSVSERIERIDRQGTFPAAVLYEQQQQFGAMLCI